MVWSFVWVVEPRGDWIDRWAFDPSLVDFSPDTFWNGSQWMALSMRVITAQFVHVDWIHLLGNVAYFFVFGVQVERRVGFVFLLLSTLMIGGLGYAAPAFFDLQADVIVAGASGAVSGMLGLYLVVCSREPVGIWLPLGLVPQRFKLPAWVLIGSWLAVQLIFALNATTYPTVAVASHFSGFVAGLSFGVLFRAVNGGQQSSHRKRFHYV
ncbi:MAG TPA: rhomboid family intramembrane serine protease [Wenzhouxiangella sp.]